jgi:hypothetical protein
MTAFEEYVDQYGFHFNKKLYEWAVSMMTDRRGSAVEPLPKERVKEWLASYGVTLDNDKGHDAAYVLAMMKADYYHSSIEDEQHLALAVRDYIDDPDGYPTKAFDHFIVDCRSKDEPVFWDEMI